MGDRGPESRAQHFKFPQLSLFTPKMAILPSSVPTHSEGHNNTILHISYWSHGSHNCSTAFSFPPSSRLRQLALPRDPLVRVRQRAALLLQQGRANRRGRVPRGQAPGTTGARKTVANDQQKYMCFVKNPSWRCKIRNVFTIDKSNK